MIITIFGCEKKFLDEPTTKGINSHSFKVNGQNMVKTRVIPPYPETGVNYNRLGINCLDAFLQADIEGDKVNPMGIVRWIITNPDNISILPKILVNCLFDSKNIYSLEVIMLNINLTGLG